MNYIPFSRTKYAFEDFPNYLEALRDPEIVYNVKELMSLLGSSAERIGQLIRSLGINSVYKNNEVFNKADVTQAKGEVDMSAEQRLKYCEQQGLKKDNYTHFYTREQIKIIASKMHRSAAAQSFVRDYDKLINDATFPEMLATYQKRQRTEMLEARCAQLRTKLKSRLNSEGGYHLYRNY